MALRNETPQKLGDWSMAGGAWRAVELHVDLPVPEYGRYSYRSAIFESSTCSPVVTSIRAGSSRKGKGRMQNSRMQNPAAARGIC